MTKGTQALACLACLLLLNFSTAFAQNIAYIHGDVAQNGNIPSGSQAPYDQMLLTDSGNNGMSRFKSLVESEGFTITQHYDAQTTLSSAFLNQFDAVIFGLHQKVWSTSDKNNLDAWIKAGGNILMYSDSAAGGRFSIVGAQNTVGQRAVNNVISQYGLEVTVDQADGTKAYRAGPGASHPIVAGRPVFEGEGVSPVAVAPDSGAQILIPYVNNADFRVSGNANVNKRQNLTIANPSFAALVLKPLGEGNIIVSFDRQPMWNNGPGSGITKRDNQEILRRIVNFMVADGTNTSQPITVSAATELLIGEAGSATLDGTISGSVTTSSWTKVSGPGSVSFASASSVDTTATFSLPGVYELMLTASNDSNTENASVTLEVVPESAITAAVNSASDAYRSITGISYQKDAFFTAGHNDQFAGAAVAGTADDELYNHARSAHTAYNVPVENGDYTVLLQFSETFFTSNNRRVFDVALEGQQIIDDLDIFATAPGKHRAYDRIFDVTVTDGILSMDFASSVNNSLLSAFVLVSRSAATTPAPVATGKAIPGRIEAEEYNQGASGVAYFDTSAGNNGKSFRNEDVDIQIAGEGGFNVGWIVKGEWLAYTVNVKESGFYDIRGRVASARNTDKAFHIEIDGTDVTGPITFNTAGAGWQAWRNVTASKVFLNAGQQELRIAMDSNSFNINYLDITPTP